VPVVNLNRESTAVGGAANVAANIRGLGDIPYLVGVAGNDESGRKLEWLLTERGISSQGVIVDPARPTTVKTRIIAHNQQVVRADHETKEPVDKKTEREIFAFIESKADQLSGLIVSDYDKGVVTPSILKKLIDLCGKKRIFIAVDPKDTNFPRYKDVSLITPNHHEAGFAYGRRIVDDDTLYEVGTGLVERLNARSILITRGEKGMALFERGKQPKIVPTVARKVFDVTGAGDTVIASFVSAVAGGADLEEATIISNHAAGYVVGEVGTAVITMDALRQTFNGLDQKKKRKSKK
jgi:D-beta-D-heptose 7-phosphate kinase/D-beta-D-heptose 1-phosphate adenosyltransferase